MSYYLQIFGFDDNDKQRWITALHLNSGVIALDVQKLLLEDKPELKIRILEQPKRENNENQT